MRRANLYWTDMTDDTHGILSECYLAGPEHPNYPSGGRNMQVRAFVTDVQHSEYWEFLETAEVFPDGKRVTRTWKRFSAPYNYLPEKDLDWLDLSDKGIDDIVKLADEYCQRGFVIAWVWLTAGGKEMRHDFHAASELQGQTRPVTMISAKDKKETIEVGTFQLSLEITGLEEWEAAVLHGALGSRWCEMSRPGKDRLREATLAALARRRLGVGLIRPDTEGRGL